MGFEVLVVCVALKWALKEGRVVEGILGCLADLRVLSVAFGSQMPRHPHCVCRYTMSSFFLLYTFLPIAAGLVLILLSPIIKRKMHGIQ